MSRLDVFVVAVALVLAIGGPAAADRESMARAVVRQMTAADLRVIGRLSGLTDEEGRGREVLPVFVEQQGGPTWATAEIVDVVEKSPWLRPDPSSPHRLQAEIVRTEADWALRLGLWRRGWSLRSPRPRRVQLSPWVAAASGVVGALVALATRVGLGLAVAGLCAQAFALSLSRPSALPSYPLATQWKEGPLGQHVIAFAGGLPDVAVAVGAGVLVLCSVLVAFDHRRSRRRGGALLWWGLLGVFGLIAWLEASARTGLLAYATTLVGGLGLTGLLGLWIWGARASSGPDE